MRIIAVRHGETDMNAERKIQGCIDTTLNQKGILQALDLRDTLPDGIEAIFFSPLLRTQETASIIRPRFSNVPFISSPPLRERSFGTLEGLSVEEALSILGHETRTSHGRIDADYRAWGGDSGEERKQEFADFLDSLSHLRYRTLLLVTHAGAIRMLYFFLDLQNLPESISNASTHEFLL